jgi:4-alpha-glucanotransferase
MSILHQRSSGVLLHPTSLPGPDGNGSLGEHALAFVDFLASASQRWWQMLPVGPAGFGNSPYSAQSAFAGNPLLIDLIELAREGLLTLEELARRPELPERRVDYGAAWVWRGTMLHRAFENFSTLPSTSSLRRDFVRFREREREWLEDFALFRALKHARSEVAWTKWEPELRSRKPSAIEHARKLLGSDALDFERFLQWSFERQWSRLREHAHAKGIALLGDLPIFVAHDSADVWAHPENFFLDRDGMPTVIAGVPPDYFSKTGQRWGNPLYRWRKLAHTGFRWWIDRLRKTLERFDAIRLDHFIGFQNYWEIPAELPTAEIGRWVPGPGAPFFEKVRRDLGALPMIAEDLGVVTPAVKRLRDAFALPGIKVLQFAFGTDPSAPDFLPHVYPRDSVVYTGTHDNDTTVGWFTDPGGGQSTRSPEQTQKERETALAYLGSPGTEIHWEMIRAAQMSVGHVAIVPMQDLLGLGSEARMNRPGTLEGNWEWRLLPGQASEALAARLGELTRIYGRAPSAERAQIVEEVPRVRTKKSKRRRR